MPLPRMNAPSVMSTLFVRLARFAGGGLLGLAVLGWVVSRCGSTTGEVVVHVVEADVDVTIDGDTYPIRGRSHDPIVHELPVGTHEMIVHRGERVLFAQSFELGGGESQVLTAWDPARLRAESASLSRRASSARSDRSGTGGLVRPASARIRPNREPRAS